MSFVGAPEASGDRSLDAAARPGCLHGTASGLGRPPHPSCPPRAGSRPPPPDSWCSFICPHTSSLRSLRWGQSE